MNHNERWQSRPIPLVPEVLEVAGHIFPGLSHSSIERVTDGVSTLVYRITHRHEVYYLRILPEHDASFAPEAAVHTRLHEHNVKVPQVVYFDHRNDLLNRSVMVTTAIPGVPLSQNPTVGSIGDILADAGCDLAIINSIPVDGFGWVKRNRPDVGGLEAEHETFRAFALDPLDESLTLLAVHGINPRIIGNIRSIIRAFDSWFDRHPQGWLAHGDLDLTHIFHQQGHYTGIIDFGEIRGANRLYDLGHFRMHDGETFPEELLPYLLAGYRDSALLREDAEEHIFLSSLLVAVRTLARAVLRHPDTRNHWALTALERDIEVIKSR